MGRKGSKLVPFLIDALNGNKYRNLKFEDVLNQTFSLFLPQNTSRLEDDCQFVLRDWFKVKNRPYRLKKDYTEGKQVIEAALHKSDFLDLVHKSRGKKLIYRILTSNEVQMKKSLKKAQKKAMKSDPYAVSEFVHSPESSGYGSGSDNNDVPEADLSHASSLHALNHDHEYIGDAGQTSLSENQQLNIVENCNFATNLPFEIKNDVLYYAMEQESADENMPFDLVENVDYGFHPTLVGNDVLNYAMEQTFTDGNMQLGFVEDVDSGTHPTSAENKEVLDDKDLPLKQLESYDPVTQNSIENLDISRFLDKILGEEFDPSQIQDLVDGINLNSTFNEDIFNYENTKFVDDVNEEVKHFSESEEYSVKNEIHGMSGLNITSYKTKVNKVYQCKYRQDMPDMIMLTCEPKLKELCMADINEKESSTPKLIFDEATMQLMSKYTLENVQFLPNDHLLVFLKCKELVY